MPNIFFKRTALIALALCLVYLAPARAASGAAPAPQTPLLIYPTTFVCLFPGVTHATVPEQRQPIPSGKQIKDLCPPGGDA